MLERFEPRLADRAAQAEMELVCKIEQLMRTAVTPSRRYEVGKLCEGGPIWHSASAFLQGFQQ